MPKVILTGGLGIEHGGYHTSLEIEGAFSVYVDRCKLFGLVMH